MSKSRTLSSLVSDGGALADGTITAADIGAQATLISGTNIKTVNGTSVLGSGNIQIDGGVTSFNTRTGAITLGSGDVTTALGFTPYNATNPNGYTTNTGTVTSVGGTGTVSGLTLTGTVTGSGNLTLGGTLSLTSGQVTTALGFTPYNATNPSGYITSSGSITGSASSATLLSALNNYIWSQSTLPTSYSSGIQCAFVGPSVGEGAWQNYGSVMTMRTYSGGGGSLQLYAPYGPGNGGTGLQVRFGNYDVSSGNAWTAWKTILASDNYTNYSPSLTGTGASGTWGINITGNAATAGGLAVHSGRNNGANQIVRTDGNGYIQAGWINTDSGDNGTTGLGRIYASQDGYIRYYSPTNFRTVLNRAVFNRESNGGTMVAGNIYSIYTGGGAVGMYLPTAVNTAQGDRIVIYNLLNQWSASNPFYVYMNTNTRLMGLNETMTCSINVGSIVLVCAYNDGTAYWTVSPGA
jgi:hypothetical protein